ncbi:hypothetical protein JXB22_07160 [candidate division WOR-3 bacterium]|nr:hypothetical protein [candidate division WOR-3 bacterium]
MREEMWEDMFTPEGIPMTSPHDAGMKGRGNGWHGTGKKADAHERKQESMTPNSTRWCA